MAEGSRLLVVDGDPATLLTHRAVLRKHGYDVATASTGGAALALVRSGHSGFSLMLVDLRLPDLSGLEVLAEVQAGWPNIPVVVMSECATPALETAARQLGATDFVQKFLRVDELLTVVRRNLRGWPPAAADAEPSGSQTPGYASARWATIIVPVTRLHADVPRVADWARVVGKAPATLKTWCAAAGVGAGDSLDFARALRVVNRYAGTRVDWFSVLDIIEHSTLAHFLERAGMAFSGTVPEVAGFLTEQRFIAPSHLLSAVVRELEARPSRERLFQP